MTMRIYDEMDVRRALKAACIAAGGNENFAQLNRFDPAYIRAARHGESTITYRLLDVLGFEPVRRYIKRGNECPAGQTMHSIG